MQLYNCICLSSKLLLLDVPLKCAQVKLRILYSDFKYKFFVEAIHYCAQESNVKDILGVHGDVMTEIFAVWILNSL